MLTRGAYSVSGKRSCFSPNVGVNKSSEFFCVVETGQDGRECVIRFVSLPHSVTCNRDKSIMLQRNKSEA